MTRKSLILAVWLPLLACGGEHAPPTAAPLPSRVVHVARAEARALPVLEEIVGTVRPVHEATIAATWGARVLEVTVTVGSVVRPGDVLVRLAASEIDARLEQARAVVTLARLERDRAAALVAQQAISAAQFDAAAAQLRVAEAAQAEAGTLAGRAVLRAPLAGVVTSKRVNAGDTAMPGAALLVIEAPGALRFEARVPEAAARGLTPGQSLPVRVEGLVRELRGTVSEIDPAADATSRTVLVKLDLAPDPELRSGRFGRLLLSASSASAVMVDPAAIVRRGQLELVFVIDGRVARLRLVRTARQHDGAIEVVSGLAGGEEVAVSDAALLRDGQPIEVAL